MNGYGHRHLSRRSFVAGAVGAAAGAALLAGGGATAAPPRRAGSAQATRASAADLFAQLDEKILGGMQRLAIPGAAVAVFHQGREYVKGYGVTNVAAPTPVDGKTLFRIGSTSKTLTGTTAMVLVDRGRLDLDRRVRHYLPGFRPPRGAGSVTVRQLLNHSAGWLGYDYHDTGRGDNALGTYAHDMRKLPQLTPVGRIFSYNNAAIALAGRVIEKVTDMPFEDAVAKYVLRPIGMSSTFYFSDEIIGHSIAAGHGVVNGAAQVDPSLWYLPREANPYGGAISSVADQLRWARFHLGDGRGARGRRVMSPRALRAMRRRPGPGGTLLVELDGFGVSWMIRPSAQGVRIIEHGGDVPGQHSGFFFVPDRNFAMTLLTNSEGGPSLVEELFFDDWALSRFAGLSNLPATPQQLDAKALAPYEGRYTAEQIGITGPPVELIVHMRASDGGLLMEEEETVRTGKQREHTPAGKYLLRFYKRDYILAYQPSGAPIYLRANFLRDRSGRISFFRFGGMLFRRRSRGQRLPRRPNMTGRAPGSRSTPSAPG
jgi:CubicO group peptidase (beta-lactamase class C family)